MQPITDFHQAELNAAKAMRSFGFVDAVATTGGADGGLDVRSVRALAQVKWRGGTTGKSYSSSRSPAIPGKQLSTPTA